MIYAQGASMCNTLHQRYHESAYGFLDLHIDLSTMSFTNNAMKLIDMSHIFWSYLVTPCLWSPHLNLFINLFGRLPRSIVNLLLLSATTSTSFDQICWLIPMAWFDYLVYYFFFQYHNLITQGLSSPCYLLITS